MSIKPYAYACPNKCGCLWRDNNDGTMSLFGFQSRSCAACEPLGLDKMVPLVVPEPDLFWSRSYPEECHNDISDVLQDYDIGEEVTIDCAMRLPDVLARRLPPKSELSDADYEIVKPKG